MLLMNCFHRLSGLTRQRMHSFQQLPQRSFASTLAMSVGSDVGSKPRISLLKSLKNKRTELEKVTGSSSTIRTSAAIAGTAQAAAIVRKQQKPIVNTQPKEIPLGRPFTLPTGLFKPKQSLGQNFLNDKNYVLKICDAFSETSSGGSRVVEIGPGPGSLTKTLFRRFPEMTAIEIDQRAVAILAKDLPGLKVLHMDVLDFDWPSLAAEKGGPVSVIGNLPYYIVSQVLFSLADSHKAVKSAVVTMQLEVAQRVCADIKSPHYGIPSVIFQLYGECKTNFKIPPNVFYPVPKVDSALVTIDFTKPHPDLFRVDGAKLRRVVNTAFNQRRKMMRRSLRVMIEAEGLTLPEHWQDKRPEQLTPPEFIQLTVDLYGEAPGWEQAQAQAKVKAKAALASKSDSEEEREEEEEEEGAGLTVHDRDFYVSNAVWRTSKWGHRKKNLDALEGRGKRLEMREGIDDRDDGED